MARSRLGARSLARSTFQIPVANSTKRALYSGPTWLDEPACGASSCATLRLRLFLARPTSVCLGSGSASGFVGTLTTGTERYPAIPERSAISHASTSRTATRKRTLGGKRSARQARNNAGGQGLLSRSVNTTCGNAWLAATNRPMPDLSGPLPPDTTTRSITRFFPEEAIRRRITASLT